MKTLEVTDEQYAVIQQLREEISEEVVGKYGFVRERDAVQFLIDTLEGNPDADVEIDAGSMPEDLEAVSYVEDNAVDDAGPEIDADADDLAVAGDDEPLESETDDESDDDDDAGGSMGGDGSADDDDMLDEMMSLLETHDDKWEESDSADYRYSVELPDGTTEEVQTKDDVRALLFKNYR